MDFPVNGLQACHRDNISQVPALPGNNISEVIGLLAFTFVLLDSLFTYFFKSFGQQVPINAFLPCFIILILIKQGIGKTPLPQFVFILGVGILYLSLLIGIATIPGVNLSRVLPLTSTLCAFYIGFFMVMSIADENRVAIFLLIAGLLYSSVCAVALLKLSPSLFPIIEAISYKKGVLHIRPEVTTDQNFQIFYLFPSILVLALPFKPIRFVLAAICLVSGLFVLSQLQTRSGALVFLGVFACCCLAPLKIRTLGRGKAFVFPVLAVGVTILALPLILDKGAGLLERFASGNFATLQGRIQSISYLFFHLFNPEWWIPQGNEGFLRATGNVPHSNPTAFYLEGGLLGLLGWLWIFLLPLVLGIILFLKERLDNLETIFLIGCFASFITQLSLNVPLFEQAWLWAGVSIGILKRHQRRGLVSGPVKVAR